MELVLEGQEWLHLLGLSENVVGILGHWPPGFVWVWPQRGEAGRGCDGDAAQPNIQTVDLRRDGHLGEEGVVSRQPCQTSIATAVAALNVFNNVEDLLPLGLTRHSTDVQDGRHVLLPERKGTGETMTFKNETISTWKLMNSCTRWEDTAENPPEKQGEHGNPQWKTPNKQPSHNLQTNTLTFAFQKCWINKIY